MTAVLASPALFYASELPPAELLTLVSYSTVAQLPTPLDVLTFPPGGGTVDRELAVPALAGMDEVVVDAARLVLRGREGAAEADGWSHLRLAEGHLIALERPGRLVALVVDAPDPAALAALTNMHVVLRSATLDAGGVWSVGPPVFAVEPFDVGAMYADSLAGMTVTPEAGGRLRIGVPPSPGQGWVLDWAQTGLDQPNDPAHLIPGGIDTTVRGVTVAPIPDSVTLVLRGDPTLPGAGADDVLLWSHPSPVAADEGPLAVDLTPMARKRLSDRLAAIRDDADPPLTLALPLRFSAGSAGEIAVEERDLAVSYAVRATSGAPARADLWGAWEAIEVRAPARTRPRDGHWSFTARHLGRELNGSPTPAPSAAAGGLVVTAERWVSVAVEVAPGPSGAGAEVALCALQARLGAPEPAEVVFELRSDVAGRPGERLATAVANLDAGTDAHVVVDLGAGLSTRPGTTLWVVARANQGQVLWWAGTVIAGAPRISTDQGVSWHLPEPTISALEPPEVRLFHAVEHPAAPAVALRVGDVRLEALPLRPVGADPLELAASGPVPPALLDALGRRPGSGPVTTVVDVSSSAVLELTLAQLTLTYDPGAGPTST